MSPESRNSFPLSEQERLHYRKRFLWLRAWLIQAIRHFFVEREYLEVETPLLIPAPAPEVHIDAIRTDAGYLHTSPELCMKRLLAAGFSRIFQISKCFRADERGERHLPEFCLLEWYRAAIDYNALMEECRELLIYVADHLGFDGKITYQGKEIDLKGPWKKISVHDAFLSYASISLEESLKKGLFDEVVVNEIEPRLISEGPVFLYDYPSSLAALARLRSDDPRFAERFEIYVAGLEVANGFSELTDKNEQKVRFEMDMQHRLDFGRPCYPMPEKFLLSLENMPEAAGVAFGVDRLAMIFGDTASIDDVVAFTPEEL